MNNSDTEKSNIKSLSWRRRVKPAGSPAVTERLQKRGPKGLHSAVSEKWEMNRWI